MGGEQVLAWQACLCILCQDSRSGRTGESGGGRCFQFSFAKEYHTALMWNMKLLTVREKSIVQGVNSEKVKENHQHALDKWRGCCPLYRIHHLLKKTECVDIENRLSLVWRMKCLSFEWIAVINCVWHVQGRINTLMPEENIWKIIWKNISGIESVKLAELWEQNLLFKWSRQNWESKLSRKISWWMQKWN